MIVVCLSCDCLMLWYPPWVDPQPRRQVFFAYFLFDFYLFRMQVFMCTCMHGMDGDQTSRL